MPQLQSSPVHRTEHPRGGFTLIELLVVIAIIGILIELLPGVQIAREMARGAITAQSTALQSVGQASLELTDRLEEVYLVQKSIMEPVAEERTEPDLALVQRNLTELLDAQHELEQLVLTLNRIHPELGDGDQALARQLRQQLRMLRVHNQRDIHLKRFLLEPVGESPELRE